MTRSWNLLGGARVLIAGWEPGTLYCAQLLRACGASVAVLEPPAGPGDAHGRDGALAALARGLDPVDLPAGGPERRAVLANRLAGTGLLIEDDWDARFGDLIPLAELTGWPTRPVVVSVSPFGVDARRSGPPAVDLNAWHASGAAWSTAAVLPAELGVPPLLAPGEQASHMAGAVAFAVGACYLVSDRPDRPWIDLSMQAAVASAERCNITSDRHGAAIADLDRRERRQLNLVRCRDGYASFTLNEDHQCQAMRQLIADTAGPVPADQPLADAICGWCASRTRYEILDLCQRARVPMFPVLDLGEVLDEPQFRDRSAFESYTGPDGRVLSVPAVPLSVTPGPVPAGRPGPARPRPGTTGAAPAGPLAGVRVLDFSWMAAGPYVTLLLAMMGAEIIKVEGVRRPDWMRRWAPLVGDGSGLECSPQFATVNLGKKSCRLDLQTGAGQEVARRLARRCDMVVENFAGSVADRLGVGYLHLAAVNPALVYVSVKPLGLTGPRAAAVAYGASLTHFTGITALTGTDATGPVPPGGYWADWCAGPVAVGGALAALARVRRDGTGAHVEVSMAEAVIATLTAGMLDAQLGRPSGPIGNGQPGYHIHGCYPCAIPGDDPVRWATVAARGDDQWRALRSRLAPGEADPDPALVEKRLEEFVAAHTFDQVRAELAPLGVAVWPSLRPRQVLDDIHLRQLGVVSEVDHPVMGRLDYMGRPWRVRGADAEPPGRAPLLGEHTDSVLGELLGMGERQRSALRHAGAIA